MEELSVEILEDTKTGLFYIWFNGSIMPDLSEGFTSKEKAILAIKEYAKCKNKILWINGELYNPIANNADLDLEPEM